MSAHSSDVLVLGGGAIQSGRLGFHFMELASGTKEATTPLHPGAVRFFTETGILKPAAQKAALPVNNTVRKS